MRRLILKSRGHRQVNGRVGKNGTRNAPVKARCA